MAKRPSSKPPFPTKEELLEFIQSSPKRVGKREIARAFGIRGQDRARLNDILRELRAEGELDRGKGRRFAKPGVLPRVTVIEVTGTDGENNNAVLHGRICRRSQTERASQVEHIDG